MDTSTAYKRIRSSGGRITKLRKSILDLFARAGCLLTSDDILRHLRRLRLSPNRSTLYRELLFLSRQQLIIPSTIAGKEYYEMPRSHHHHMVCIRCRAIERISFGNHMAHHERRLAREKNFSVVRHSLEFYGYCHKCQT